MKRFLLAILAVFAIVPAAAACSPPPAAVIDHIAIGYLPPGLGTPSDFEYEYDDVAFVARVWESQIPEGWRVDLDIDVMRGDRLASPKTLHDWFIAYEERDPTPTYQRVRVQGHRGWLCRDQLFWLIKPGLAVSVTIDGTRWTRHEVRHIALSADVSPRSRRATS